MFVKSSERSNQEPSQDRPHSRSGLSTPIDNSMLLKTPNSHMVDHFIRTSHSSGMLEQSRPSTSHGSTGAAGSSRPKTAVAVGAAMQAARIERKRTESELQIILNRVSLLRAEEQKGLNKITETKMRAKEVLQLKKRDEEAYQSRVAQELRKQEALQEIADKSAAEKERRKKKLAEKKKLLLDSRIIVAQESKDITRRNEEMKRRDKELLEEERKNAISAEKERQRLMKIQIEQEREDKIKIMREEFENRAHEEYIRKIESEQIILELEREEKELLGRLAKTQALQEKAYSILQRTLSS